MPTKQAAALPKVHIEVMIDTNANSRDMNNDVKTVRELLEFRDYMSVAGQLDGVEYYVTQRDTAQIFHEKTGCLTPDLAKQARAKLSRMMQAAVDSDYYHVEPPVHGEEEYYTALATFFLAVLPDMDPQALKDRHLQKPEDFSHRDLQDLFMEHLHGKDWSKTFKGTKHEAAYRAFHTVRFNAGEETAINFLRDHPHAPAGERTAFIFVGADKWANKNMATARAGKQDDGKFEVFVGGVHQFRQIIDTIVRDIEKHHPEMRQLRRSNFRELARIDSDPEPLDLPRSTGVGDRMLFEGERLSALVPEPRDDTQKIRYESEETRNFADFVLGLRSESDQKRSQGRR